MRVTDDHEQHRFFRGAAVIASLTMLSRVFGLARDAAISAMGATHTMGAFRVAFSIPNLFRRLFGEGAVAASFVPVFTEVAEAEGWDKARLVLANAAGLLAVILAAIVAAGELALLLCLLIAPGDADHTLLLQLTMIVLPFMGTVCLLALGSAALNCKGHFAYPAFAPILLNIFMIAGALVAYACFEGGTWRGLFVLASGVTAAGVVQVVGVVWLLKRVKLAAMPQLRPVLPAVRRIASLMVPMIVPIGILQFSAFFDRIYAHFLSAGPSRETLTIFGLEIARPLGEGVVTWFDNANRLYQFPMAIFGISLATAVFPLFSRYAAAGDVDGLRSTTNRALRLSLFLGVPSGVALALLAEPAMAVIFRRGKFLTNDAVSAAMILRMYCLGMWAYFCNHILLRAFFSQKDTRTPLRVSCALVVLNMIMVTTLVFTPLRSGALGLATAATSTVNSIVLIAILRARWGQLGLQSVFASLARIVIAAAGMAGAVFAVLRLLLPALPEATNAQAGLALLVCIPLGGGAFLGLAWVLRSPELTELWASLRRREHDANQTPTKL